MRHEVHDSASAEAADQGVEESDVAGFQLVGSRAEDIDINPPKASFIPDRSVRADREACPVTAE